MYTDDMYLAVDIGGSKTLLAGFDDNGQVAAEAKFATPKDYDLFLSALRSSLTKLHAGGKFTAACVAAPGEIDRTNGMALDFGNLPWHHTPIKDDVQEIVGHVPVYVENDANLAGLSEALLVQDRYKKVLYLTISTGIGDGVIINGMIDPDFADSEAGQMVMDHGGKLQKWEDFASGRALMAKYGKRASEIDDPAIWKEFVKGLAIGIGELAATLTPEVIILGGGVGAHFDKFGSFLDQELMNFESKLVHIPPIIEAQRPEEAVIYGCYDFIKQHG